MSESTDVDTDAVVEFAGRLLERWQAFGQDVSSAQLPMAGANLGGSGMAESAAAAGSYSAAMQATRQFLQDATDGLQALSYAAATVAQNYRDTDDDQAVTMSTVAAAFAPAPGQESITSRRAQAEAEAAAAAVAALPGHREEVRFQNQVDAVVVPGNQEQQRFQNQVAAARPSTDNRYSSAADAVADHNEFVGGNAYQPDSAENEYRPAQEYQEAVDDAAERSEHDNIPYAVVVDDHGRSEVVQADPDDVPHPDPVPPYTQLDPGVTAYQPYPATGD